MAVDLVENAYEDNFDIAVLVSGDGDFVPAVRSVKKRNKVIKNVYFKNSSSRNLKNFCDESLELTKEMLDKLFNK
ncbi:MAG TPA: NYN domain-containing protein [Nanoarchaeota archaeon]|nr:NYN domain-containing protein [Nanoarchaeota archaeon]